MALSTRIYTAQDLLSIEAERKFYQQQMEHWIESSVSDPRANDGDFAVCCLILMATYAYGQEPIVSTADADVSAQPYLAALRHENEHIAHAKQVLTDHNEDIVRTTTPSRSWWTRVLRWLGLS